MPPVATFPEELLPCGGGGVFPSDPLIMDMVPPYEILSPREGNQPITARVWQIRVLDSARAWLPSWEHFCTA